jgi:hypothetical protein
LNKAGVLATHLFTYIVLHDPTDAVAMVGYLNSSICKLNCELHGRQYTGLLDMETTDVKDLPVLDVINLNSKEKKRIEKAFEDLAISVQRRYEIDAALLMNKSKSEKVKGLFEDEYRVELGKCILEQQKAQEALDSVVYDILKLNQAERAQVEQGLKQLLEMRRARTLE